MMAASAFELPEDKRDTKRQRLLLTAQLEDVHGLRDVHLLNISATGAKIDAEETPVQGDPVTLIVGGLRVAGRVAWVDEHRFGVSFDMPIDARQLLARGQNHLAG
jgi:hypothetical protein